MILIAAAGLLWLVLARLHRESVESPSVRGVYLGMTPETTRAAFLDGAVGNWSAAPGCYAPTLEWTRADAHASTTRWARFEFHHGHLVAIRLLAEPGSSVSSRVQVTADAVAETRAGADGSTSTTVLARGCEMHEAEVRMLMSSATSEESH